MQDIMFVYLFHTLDYLRENQQILATIDHTFATVRGHEAVALLLVAFLQELFKWLPRAVLHLNHNINRVELLILFQEVIHSNLRELCSVVPARLVIILFIIVVVLFIVIMRRLIIWFIYLDIQLTFLFKRILLYLMTFDFLDGWLLLDLSKFGSLGLGLVWRGLVWWAVVIRTWIRARTTTAWIIIVITRCHRVIIRLLGATDPRNSLRSFLHTPESRFPCRVSDATELTLAAYCVWWLRPFVALENALILIPPALPYLIRIDILARQVCLFCVFKWIPLETQWRPSISYLVDFYAQFTTFCFDIIWTMLSRDIGLSWLYIDYFLFILCDLFLFSENILHLILAIFILCFLIELLLNLIRNRKLMRTTFLHLPKNSAGHLRDACQRVYWLPALLESLSALLQLETVPLESAAETRRRLLPPWIRAKATEQLRFPPLPFTPRQMRRIQWLLTH